MMTKEEAPEESHYYGAFFTSAQSMTSELPGERTGPNFRPYDRTSINGPECDLANPDLISRVQDNTNKIVVPNGDKIKESLARFIAPEGLQDSAVQLNGSP